ncbi:helix-turn-helix domain-containing protein [Paraburkholderia panacisoli]|jgi:transcriptional regulator with XRE-family HTH domain|nr:helix-turn-helix transcriptional regulator [Paraburkholderia panacisoli]
MTSLAERFAQNLKWCREELGWSQSELASRAEVDSTLISRIERNLVSVSLDRAARFAQVLGVELSALLDTPKGTKVPFGIHSLGTISSAQVMANVKAMREATGLSQSVVAKRATLQRGHISVLEKGETKLYLKTLEKLAAALKVTPGQLL